MKELSVKSPRRKKKRKERVVVKRGEGETARGHREHSGPDGRFNAK